MDLEKKRELPQRVSNRLKGYDYSQNNAYFVTICLEERKPLLGVSIGRENEEGNVVPHAASKIITSGITKRHHRVGIYDDAVGATLCGRPSSAGKMVEKWLNEIENKYSGVWLDTYVVMPDHVHFILVIGKNAGDHAGSPLQETMESLEKGNPLGAIVGWFKTMSTNEYIKGVKSGKYSSYQKRFWQRDYYEHIIRNEDDMYEIRRYIHENPIRWRIDGKELFEMA